jgi:hypothetical protein
VAGPIEYDGSPLFIPRSLGHVDPDPDVPQALSFDYETRVRYRDTSNTATEIIALFNPLTLFGFPIARIVIDVEAQLEVLDHGRAIRIYESRCTVTQTRTLYSGGNMSALRQDGLLAVRDSIDAQIAQEWEALSRTIEVDDPPGESSREEKDPRDD